MAKQSLQRNVSFLPQLLALAWPVALHQFFMVAVQIVDIIMIGQIDTVSIAAVNLASQSFFIFLLLMIGVTSGSAIFTAQYWGNSDTEGVQRTLGLTLIASCVISVVFSSLAFLFAEDIMRFYTTDVAVIAAGAQYLEITAFVFPLVGIKLVYASILRSIHDVQTPLFVSVVTLVLNVVLNYIFIFGKFGCPALGIEGAALGTLFARLVELPLLFIFLRMKSSLLIAPVSRLFHFPAGFIGKVLHTSYPVMLNEVGWAIGMSFYNKIYAGISTEAITTVAIVESATHFFMVFFFGTSSAISVLIGNRIGESDFDTAQEYGKSMQFLAPIAACCFAVVLVMLSGIIPKLYGVSGEVFKTTQTLLICHAFLFPFKVFNLHTVNGILRSGGDTRYSLMMDIGGVWFIGVPMALLAAKVLDLPLVGVYLLLNTEEIVKAVVGFYRVRSKKWIRRVIK